MGDAKNTSTVEVPRDLVARIIECLDNDLVERDLRACIKPRRWEFGNHWGHEPFLRRGLAADDAISTERGGNHVIPVRVIVEEIIP